MLKQAARYAPAVFVPLAVNAVLVYLYANVLAPEEYGVLNVVLNSIMLLYTALLSYLQYAAFRLYTADGLDEREPTYVSTYVIGNLVTGMGVAVGLYIVSRFVPFDWGLVAFALVANGLFQFNITLHRLRDATRRYSQARVGASLLSLGLFALLAVFVPRVGYRHVVLTIYASYAVVAGAMLIRERDILRFRRFSRSVLQASWRYGAPMMGVALLGLVVAYSDQFLILHLLGKTEVGYYSLGYRLSEMAIGNVTAAILVVSTPMLMRLYDRGDTGGARHFIGSTIALDLWAVLPIVGAFFVYAAPLLTWVFPEYVAAAGVLQVVCFASALNSVSMILCKGLELPKRTRRLLSCLGVAALVNVVYNLVFIPVYGVLAAAHSSVIAYAVYAILLWTQSSRQLIGELPWKSLLRILSVLCVTVLTGVGMQYMYPVRSVAQLLVELGVCIAVYMLGSRSLGLHTAFRTEG